VISDLTGTDEIASLIGKEIGIPDKFPATLRKGAADDPIFENL
jgi:hypothetical protein